MSKQFKHEKYTSTSFPSHTVETDMIWQQEVVCSNSQKH